MLIAGALVAGGCAEDGEGIADSPPGTGGMAHGSGTQSANAPFDATFIDSMIPHHEGAIEMANQALKTSKRPELITMARGIVESQQAEIARLRAWREQWYPGLAPTGGMNMPMGAMEMGADPNVAFDVRFIDAMIPHHEGAITMAEAALTKAQHTEIRQMAQEIIAAQKAEIAQMKQWKQAWQAR
jgi:uncharacterized protein (DUF305 family)